MGAGKAGFDLVALGDGEHGIMIDGSGRNSKFSETLKQRVAGQRHVSILKNQRVLRNAGDNHRGVAYFVALHPVKSLQTAPCNAGTLAP